MYLNVDARQYREKNFKIARKGLKSKFKYVVMETRKLNGKKGPLTSWAVSVANSGPLMECGSIGMVQAFGRNNVGQFGNLRQYNP